MAPGPREPTTAGTSRRFPSVDHRAPPRVCSRLSRLQLRGSLGLMLSIALRRARVAHRVTRAAVGPRSDWRFEQRRGPAGSVIVRPRRQPPRAPSGQAPRARSVPCSRLAIIGRRTCSACGLEQTVRLYSPTWPLRVVGDQGERIAPTRKDCHMGKLVGVEFLSFDGVMQGLGSPDEAATRLRATGCARRTSTVHDVVEQ